MAHPERPPILGPPGQHFVFVLIDSRPRSTDPMTIFVSPLDGAIVNSIGFKLNFLAMESHHAQQHVARDDYTL
jgi:hypothetical protein